jgi:CubicO group peptidase (beta-lactamase class C family)
MRTFACLALGLAPLTWSTTGAQTPRPEPFPGLDAYVTAALTTWQVPGLSLAIVRHDSVLYTRGYGVRTIGKPDRVDDQTIFALASTSKAFTATAVAMLVDDGKMHWDDRATTFLPGFQLYDPYATRELTIRDMLTHRSGLARGELIWLYSGLDRDEILRRIRYLKPSWGFRSQFGYQNMMYVAAGQAVANASGMTWDEFLRRRIFTPLGMTSTTTTLASLGRFQNVASPHIAVGDTIRTTAFYHNDPMGPAGSIMTNAHDMAQWLRLQLGSGTVDGKKLVSAAALDETHTPQTIIRLEGTEKRLYPMASFLSYGMGWFVSDYRGHVVAEHGGNINGFTAVAAMLPKDDFGVVVLTNKNGTLLTYALMDWLFDRDLGAPARDWSAEFFKNYQLLRARGDSIAKRQEAQRVTGTQPTLPLDRYAGTYRDSAYGTAVVTVANGSLTFTRGELVGNLEHWNYDTFRATWDTPILGKSLISFRVNGAGAVGSIALPLAGDTVVFARDTAYRSGT